MTNCNQSLKSLQQMFKYTCLNNLSFIVIAPLDIVKIDPPMLEDDAVVDTEDLSPPPSYKTTED